MGLGDVKPAIQGSEPVVWAALSDGLQSFSMAVVGWEIPAPHGDDYDEWLVVRIRVSSRFGDWEAQAAPFVAGALPPLAHWARRLADDKRVRNLYYVDPELEFGGTSDGEARRVTVTLRQFYAPDELDDLDDGFGMELVVDAAALRAFAAVIERQAVRFPSGAFR